MQTADETIINVQEIEPRLRHQTIFDVFDGLQQAESLIIHNNHDPMPVYYQLMDIRGNIFTWEYLQRGPEWWDIRVTKVVGTVSDNVKEFILNVPGLEPASKHETIFRICNNLQQGDSFIIHNDHDPRPVYYHLKEQHGDVFGWEYLSEGPERWDVRISRNASGQTAQPKPAAAQPEAAAAPVNKDGVRIVDVPSLEPRLKHPTIFKTFDALQPGESLIIHNDHDPKPVYYQLQSERGDVFTWEYLQQGPQWWDIKVTRKGTETQETIGEIVAKDLSKAEVFKKYGIDFCCNGKRTVREACAAKGIDPVLVEKDLQKPTEGVTGSRMNYDEWSPDFLGDYVVNTHHNYTRKYLPELVAYSTKVAKVHGDRHPELLKIKELVDRVNQEMSDHMVEEENSLFPIVKELVKAKNAGTKYTVPSGRTFAEMVVETEKEHDSVGRAMEEIRKQSKDYAIPEDACTSYTLLYKMLEEFESDLFIHIHLENNIMFPKAIEIEKSLS